MAEIIETKIGLGYTDGYRFIGIQPPLSAIETEALIGEGLVASKGHIETHIGEHACSLLRYGTGGVMGK